MVPVALPLVHNLVHHPIVTTRSERVQRRLAAIFAADVEGYSRLMNVDEPGTLNALTSHRKIMDGIIGQYGGRIANTAGDSVLAEFPSVVDAVECAVAIQGKLGEMNAEVASEQTLWFRIGIHVGDVMVQGGDLLGDSVNVAARVQALADSGGVSLSGRAYEEVEGKLPHRFEDRGEQQVKNIARPVRVFAVAGGRTSPAQTKHLPMPNKPSIAVLPFTNMSSDPEQEYFSRGLADDLIVALTDVRSILVTPRHVSFGFDTTIMSPEQIGRELGVRYIFEGSLRRSREQLRLTAQVIETETSHHVWAGKFDAESHDIFKVQDKLTRAIIGAIEPKIRLHQVQVARSKAGKLSSYDHYLRALHHAYRFRKDDNEAALQHLKAAIQTDSDYALAYSFSAFLLAERTYQGWSDDREADALEATRLARLAIQMTVDDPRILIHSANALSVTGTDVGLAARLGERALELSPNLGETVAQTAWFQLLAGRYDLSRDRFLKARELSPQDPSIALWEGGLALSYMFLECFDEAVRWACECIAKNPRFMLAHRCLAASYALAGRQAEAEKTAADMLLIDPHARVSHIALGSDQMPKAEMYTRGLRLAGVLE